MHSATAAPSLPYLRRWLSRDYQHVFKCNEHDVEAIWSFPDGPFQVKSLHTTQKNEIHWKHAGSCNRGRRTGWAWSQKLTFRHFPPCSQSIVPEIRQMTWSHFIRSRREVSINLKKLRKQREAKIEKQNLLKFAVQSIKECRCELSSFLAAFTRILGQQRHFRKAGGA